MNQLKRLILSLAALLLFTGVAMVAPAAARGTDDAANNSSTEPVVADDSTAGNTSDSEATNLAEQFKQQAQEKLQLARQDHNLATEVVREKACLARKASLTNRMSNAVNQAKRHKAVFDNIYGRVKEFYTTKHLNVPNYSSLTAAVDTAQADAQTKIDALASLNVNVDCSSQTVADSISAFQQAESASRDSLKAYRAALTDLINSLKGASTGADQNSTAGSNTNGTNQ
jgi:hypothetical protein